MTDKKHCTIYRNDKGELHVNCANVSFEEIEEAEKQFLVNEKHRNHIAGSIVYNFCVVCKKEMRSFGDVCDQCKKNKHA